MKKKILVISILCLTLGIRVLSVSASGFTGESTAGISFTDDDPKDPDPEEPSEEEREESLSTSEEPKESWQKESTSTGESASVVKTGGVLPQTGDRNNMALPVVGGSALLIILYGMSRKR